MGTKLFMPSLSPTMEEGTIAKWHVKVGDKISQDTLLCSVETDKTTVDYNSLDEGFLRAIVSAEGAVVKVNDLIGYLTDTADEAFEEELKAELAAQASVATNPAAEAAQTQAPAAAAAPAPAPTPIATPSFQAPNFQASNAPSSTSPAAEVKASPLARKIAAEKGLDLSGVIGSGPGGRIVVADLAQASAPKAQAAKVSAKKEVPSNPLIGSMAPVMPTRDEPMSTMQKVVGKRLLESYVGAPAFFVSTKICVDEVNALRAKLNTVQGYKISVNDLVLKAVAANLRRFPLVNATLVGDSIRYNANIDVSVAVAIDGGLITPIIKDTDRKPLGIVSAEMKDLASRAKKGQLQPHEFQGGTFTVSNLGMFGVSAFTSIINPPQSAILAVAGTEEVLFRDEEGGIGVKNVMTVTLTADHRVINGAVAAEFVQGLKELLENPVSLML
jgi:pyruvate dehydrogenase E2 component (dihydrolipoamide acetyltransferase)